MGVVTERCATVCSWIGRAVAAGDARIPSDRPRPQAFGPKRAHLGSNRYQGTMSR